ncbi:DUF411 domain-containing protein [Parasphingopyxis marina]|uniref:DUF411 domain-containing protein n=1 Tax=Parasphingopyxis marina TaxID=2761622 RepID=A0A842HYK7_9SPHN|nr:DUF411 domain-containing protein [Parasphingopyxis marina]MBC2777557.1 DUF411 domain-containing protein [Parasphingopyxis marina]
MPNLSRRTFVASVPLVFIACTGESDETQAAALLEADQAQAPELVVYKTPTCGCCNAWVDHMRAAGFAVRTIEVADTGPIATESGVPPALRSCHTGLVAGYAIEGHVPAGDVRRLLDEQPDVAGLAVPGMPAGSPGMEMGDRTDPYRVIAFNRDGSGGIFASY